MALTEYDDLLATSHSTVPLPTQYRTPESVLDALELDPGMLLSELSAFEALDIGASETAAAMTALKRAATWLLVRLRPCGVRLDALLPADASALAMLVVKAALAELTAQAGMPALARNYRAVAVEIGCSLAGDAFNPGTDAGSSRTDTPPGPALGAVNVPGRREYP